MMEKKLKINPSHIDHNRPDTLFYFAWVAVAIALFENNYFALPMMFYLLWLKPKKIYLVLLIFGSIFLTKNVPPSNCFSTTKIVKIAKNRWLYTGYFNNKLTKIIFTDKRPIANSDLAITGDIIKGSFIPKTIRATKIPNLSEMRFQITKKLKSLFYKYFRREVASFFCTILLGQKGDPVLLNAFRRLGIAHILAISGLHFTLVCTLLYLLVKRFFLYRTTLFIIFLGATFYMLLLGATPSILRAYLFIIFHLLAKIYGKETDSLHLLNICAIISLALDPNTLFDCRFILSFGSCFGLIAFQSSIAKYFMPASFSAPSKESSYCYHSAIRKIFCTCY